MSRRPWLAMLAVALTMGGVLTFALADDGDAPRLDEVPITASERAHWAYQPVQAFEPPQVADAAWNANPIDTFIQARLERRGIAALPAAGKLTLLRRVCFDLTGLPPTAEQIEVYLSDDAPDAYLRLVDRLLDTPAYGERYAQHWLDLARFAETDGFEHDLVRPNAWRYRDWVIDALNRDLPYDEFLRQQLAGDELYPDDPQAAVATGFLLCGPDMPDINLQQERRHVVLNEMTATVGSAVLAMQFGCAQCHDHKYDPIRIHDFYRLRAFFESAELFRDLPIPTPAEQAAQAEAEAARGEQYHQAMKRRDELERQGRELAQKTNPDAPAELKRSLAELTEAERAEHTAAVTIIKQAPPLPELPLGRIVRPGKKHDAHIYLRGDFRQLGPVVDCAFPGVLNDETNADVEHAAERPRTVLAEWLTQPDHPLTARVMVNRLWQWHFGRGLSSTPSDFGTMGVEPTHPELLDWLARRFVADGWSMKAMHRLIVTSRTYQTASVPYDAEWPASVIAQARERIAKNEAADPDNELWWRRSLVRLDGEAVRDAMLVACGQLSARRGGPGIRPPLAPEIKQTLLRGQWEPSGDAEDHRRRSIYLFVRRNLRYPMFDVFDRPDTNASCPQRHESTTATQSLTQFNSAFSLECARALAGAACPTGSLREAVAAAQLRVNGRSATEEELTLATGFLEKQSERLRAEGREAQSLALPLGFQGDDPHRAAALVDYCLALFNANAFLCVE